jgi:2-iminobutanoate/2-iminopropanoate deaminase
MSKQIIQSNKVPAPIGPYSQAIVANGMVYTSGQIAIDPNTGEYAPADIEAEAELVMKNLEALLEASGSDFSSVVKTSIFLQSMSDFAQVNAVYAKYMVAPFPARETVEVAQLPKSAKVEISMIAIVK